LIGPLNIFGEFYEYNWIYCRELVLCLQVKSSDLMGK